MRLEAEARAIMRKLKGWDREAMREDFRDHPEEHRKELLWVIKRLEKILKTKKGVYE